MLYYTSTERESANPTERKIKMTLKNITNEQERIDAIKEFAKYAQWSRHTSEALQDCTPKELACFLYHNTNDCNFTQIYKDGELIASYGNNHADIDEYYVVGHEFVKGYEFRYQTRALAEFALQIKTR